MLELFRDRNFTIYWLGEFVSVVGDHISIIAFPLLVLQLTGSVAMTGLVFAAQGLPRAILMLVGGAIVDRTDPRFVMLLTNLLRFIVVLITAYLIYLDKINLQMIFVLALIFGLVDAFFYPANSAIVPSLVSVEKLRSANALVQGALWVGVIVGPAMAAFLIAGEFTTMGHGEGAEGASYESNREGFARAFFVDALTFGISFLSLIFVRTKKLDDEKKDQSGNKPSIVAEVRQAIVWVWSIPAMRLGFIGIAGLDFFFQAPFLIGFPALAKLRFVEPAYVYGLMITARGCGALVGVIMAGLFDEMRERTLVRNTFFVWVVSSASIGLVVLYEPYWFALALFFLSGVGDSYVWVNFSTWVMKKTPEKLLGRVMSILTFMSVGLLPVACMAMGLALEWKLEATLLAVSAILIVGCIVAGMHPDALYREQPEGEREC